MRLLPSGQERQQLHLFYGQTLHRVYEHSDSESKSLIGQEDANRLFLLSVHHYNEGKELLVTQKYRLKLARQNLEAAKITFAQSAFRQTSSYLESGLELVGRVDGWTNEYELTLEMSTMLVHIHYCQGEQSEAQEEIKEVLEHVQCFKDSLPVLRTQVLLLFDECEAEECIRILIDILGKLGLKIPKRFWLLNIVRSYLRLSRFLKTNTIDEIVADMEAPTTDELAETADQIAGFCALLGEVGYFFGQLEIILLATTNFVGYNAARAGSQRRVSLTLAAVALMHSLLGANTNAKPFAEKALELAESMTYPSEDGRAFLICDFFCMRSFYPYTDSLDSALKVLQAYLDYGVIEYVHICATNYLHLYFVSGLSLQPMEKECSRFVELLQGYSQDRGLLMVLPTAQFVDCLAGRTVDPLVLSGQYMKENKFVDRLNAAHDKLTLHILHLYRMILAVFFGEYSMAEANARMLLPRHQELPPFGLMRDCYSGLLAFAHGNKRRGRALLRKFERAVKEGNPNAHHMMLILRAELLAAAKPTQTGCEATRRAFDCAIAASARAGFLHHHALANERAAKFCERAKHIEPESGWSLTYYTRAIRLYGEWGAGAKVKQLLRKFPELANTLKGMDFSDGSGRGLRSKARANAVTCTHSKMQQSLL